MLSSDCHRPAKAASPQPGPAAVFSFGWPLLVSAPFRHFTPPESGCTRRYRTVANVSFLKGVQAGHEHSAFVNASYLLADVFRFELEQVFADFNLSESDLGHGFRGNAGDMLPFAVPACGRKPPREPMAVKTSRTDIEQLLQALNVAILQVKMADLECAAPAALRESDDYDDVEAADGERIFNLSAPHAPPAKQKFASHPIESFKERRQSSGKEDQIGAYGHTVSCTHFGLPAAAQVAWLMSAAAEQTLHQQMTLPA